MKLLRRIEEKWQKEWEQAKIFEANPDSKRKKCFVTFPYPYMNGPLHVGHGFTASRVDAYARLKRMQGYNVLFPWAWHWTGQPLMGASKRVECRDKEFIKALKEVDGVSEENLKRFVDPAYMATYYTDEARQAAKHMGFTIDWRREFQTTAPTFSKFVEWQYERLREKGYVVKGTHPVVYCPTCDSPTGDADRQEGEGVAPEEYTLMKFKLEDAFLPAATFRPETIYAVTNMWINPDADYVKAQVDGEKWIISEKAADKLRHQQRKITILVQFKGKKLVNKYFTSPINGAKLPILPGWFVNPAHATGIVYSVPAHAPYDWLALKDLQKSERLKEFGIKPELLKKIQPISMIKVEGYGDYPAIEIVEQLGAKDQYDPKAEEATKTLYKKEFHGGILKDICGEYAGKPVSTIKDQIIRDFKAKGIADSMYDLPHPVTCRCLTPCSVKILEDQWFLKYSDIEWKNKTKEALNQATVYPQSAVQWFLNVIDWLKEWACARKTGLGTPLPWSLGWIVETLSDSTIYMAFYTINKHIKEHNIKPEQLTKEVFDYIYYSKGNPQTIAKNSDMKTELLDSMRQEFLYWYPVDLRNSAKELVPNHLTFFLFHHVAMFPEYLPKAVGVNGMLMVKGKPMHKSKGNFVTLKNAIDEYGADATRCAVLLAAEEMDDPDWREENIRDVSSKIESFYNLATNIIKMKKQGKRGHLEEWLISMLQHRIKKVTENIETLKTRTAIENAFYETWNDVRWYIRRKEESHTETLKEALETWTRMLAPFVPYVCEEIWSQMKKEGFISLAKWPTYDEDKVNVKAEETENLITNVLDDTSNIIRATKITPRQICYYTAALWKWEIYQKALDKSATTKKIALSDFMKELMQDSELRKMAEKVAKFVNQIVTEINEMPEEKKHRQLQVNVINEQETLTDATKFFEHEFNAKVFVCQEGEAKRYDPKKRAELAKPYRPAIYIE